MGDDPYLHLHVEDYERPFEKGRVTWRDMIAMGGRERISLNGKWRFVTDLFDEGLRQKWYLDEPSDPHTWSVPRDYDGGDWQMAPVPSCWNGLKPEWTHFEGSAWYMRTFEAPALKPHENLFLRIGAANYEARIFINGQFAGAHRGGSTPFFVRIGALVHEGTNRLQIQVENRRRPDRVPMNHIDWFNYGGLYRDVDLIRVPETHIKHVHVALEPGSGFSQIVAEMDLSAPVDGPARLVIAELGLDETFAVVGGKGKTVIAAKPELWSPNNPKLYDVTITCQGDQVCERIGFREVRVRGHAILLNGQPIWLRGVCCHEDDMDLGKATTEADIWRRLDHVRALGANAVRLSHYPHHERVAEIADEIGLLLIEEIPVYWAIDFDNPDTLSDAENQLGEMIRRDINRASVIMWGVGNENADDDPRLAFMTHLAKTARAMDPTRLITAACLINREHFIIEDRLTEALDVVGLNEYFGWYEPGFEGLETLLSSSTPDKPVIISECGADAVTGHIGKEGELFSEAHQAYVLDRQFAASRNAPYIQGFFPWLLYDFRTERRQTALQRGYNLKGLIDRDKNRKKLAFSKLRDHYHSIAD